jgi:tRNA pseudouridine55 synthase
MLLINKRVCQKFKIGHAGTLDPLASGLLLVCTGKFTKRITELQGQAKENELFIGPQRHHMI